MTTKVFWAPAGFNLDQIGDKRFDSIADGDTPKVVMSIRMLSVDTPEKKPVARGLSKAEAIDLFPRVRDWVMTGDSPVGPALAAHLADKLDRADAPQAHWAQGDAATAAHKALTETRLTRPSGTKRNLFLRVADERFDRYGRLLAYTAPSYSSEELRSMTRAERSTFNLDMVANGWGATLVIYPSIPGELDLPLLQQAARRAIEEKRGAWADPRALAGYEYRMIERLALMLQKIEAGDAPSSSDLSGWVTRYCADISTGLLYPPQDYCRVDPWNRLFIWRDDVRAAVGQLNLVPAAGFGST
jgi:endonuclease YncB( thermonuclease family)